MHLPDEYMMHWQPAAIQAQSPALNHILQMHFWALGDELHQDLQLPASQTIVAVLRASGWHESRMHWLPPVIGTQSVALNQEVDAVRRSGRCVSPACIFSSCPLVMLTWNLFWARICCDAVINWACLDLESFNIQLCSRRTYAANVNIYNPFTKFVSAVELSLSARLSKIVLCCCCNRMKGHNCNRRDPKSTIAHPLITKQQLCGRHDNHQMHRHKNQQRPNHASKKNHYWIWMLGALNP